MLNKRKRENNVAKLLSEGVSTFIASAEGDIETLAELIPFCDNLKKESIDALKAAVLLDNQRKLKSKALCECGSKKVVKSTCTCLTNNIRCEDCSVMCTNCENFLCKECGITCDFDDGLGGKGCGELVCKNCVQSPECERSVRGCEDCFGEYICPDCDICGY